MASRVMAFMETTPSGSASRRFGRAASVCTVFYLLVSLILVELRTINARQCLCCSSVCNLDTRNLEKIPNDLFSIDYNKYKFTTLNVQNNRLSKVDTDQMKYLLNTEVIDLSKNPIKHLDKNTFEHNTALIKLYMDSTKLEELPVGVFQNNKKLREFRCNGCSLTSIPKGVFTDLPYLHTVDLRKNKISNFKAGVFDLPVLQHLKLEGNPLSCEPNFCEWVSPIVSYVDENAKCKHMNHIGSSLKTLCVAKTCKVPGIPNSLSTKQWTLNYMRSGTNVCLVGYSFSQDNPKDRFKEVKCTEHGLDRDVGKCSDVDECKRDSCDKISTNCVNTVGSFKCTCKPGFIPNGAQMCTDIDECKQSLAKCNKGLNCTNTIGSYTCGCPQGYRSDGANPDVCKDVDECTIKSHKCTFPGSTCHNSPGSYKCGCPAGYTGNGNGAKGCIDLDECVTGGHSCTRAHSKCENTLGSFTCGCKMGFVGKGQAAGRCIDVDECARGSHNCSHPKATCTNTPGSYTCKCPKGYSGNGRKPDGCNDLPPQPKLVLTGESKRQQTYQVQTLQSQPSSAPKVPLAKPAPKTAPTVAAGTVPSSATNPPLAPQTPGPPSAPKVPSAPEAPMPPSAPNATVAPQASVAANVTLAPQGLLLPSASNVPSAVQGPMLPSAPNALSAPKAPPRATIASNASKTKAAGTKVVISATKVVISAPRLTPAPHPGMHLATQHADGDQFTNEKDLDGENSNKTQNPNGGDTQKSSWFSGFNPSSLTGKIAVGVAGFLSIGIPAVVCVIVSLRRKQRRISGGRYSSLKRDLRTASRHPGTIYRSNTYFGPEEKPRSSAYDVYNGTKFGNRKSHRSRPSKRHEYDLFEVPKRHSRRYRHDDYDRLREHTRRKHRHRSEEYERLRRQDLYDDDYAKLARQSMYDEHFTPVRRPRHHRPGGGQPRPPPRSTSERRGFH